MDNLIRQAAQRLAAGKLVAFPTETVYGLGADATNPQAIARIYAAKGRPANHPVIVHVAPDANLDYWASSIPPQARALMQAFWPGPLTLILPRCEHIPDAVSGGLPSIGLRCPSHPVAMQLLQEFARLTPHGHGGVAAPSANKFGHVSPTSSAHVRSEFSELSDDELMILDGGLSQVGIESTIVDLSRVDSGIGPVLLRPGHISADDIAAVLGVQPAKPDLAAPQVSGSLKAHYAPHTSLYLLSLDVLLDSLNRWSSDQAVAVLAFQPPSVATPAHVHWHVATADPREYARDLYATMRRLDAQGYHAILIQEPPQTLEWQAVNDRLGRAAAAFSE
ncbi:MAG: threonylcarbamoyl-AMP synthase [Burkholderiaceae bacterium]|nr:threonylcarbamoyl-AMP synthase [Burkholderiaceae bacterium]